MTTSFRWVPSNEPDSTSGKAVYTLPPHTWTITLSDFETASRLDRYFKAAYKAGKHDAHIELQQALNQTFTEYNLRIQGAP